MRTNMHRASPSDAASRTTTQSAVLPRLLTMAEVADRLNITERHIRRLVFERRISYRKIGRFVRFHPEDLAEYVAGQRIEADDHSWRFR